MKPFYEALYGDAGAGGLAESAASTMSASFYSPVANPAATAGQPGDAAALKQESRELAGFLHRDFSQVEAESFTRTLSPWVRPIAHVIPDDAMARSEFAGAKALYAKHGAVDSERLIKEAHVALRHIVKQAPTLRRTLIDNGAANDPSVIEYLAGLARSKKWK